MLKDGGRALGRYIGWIAGLVAWILIASPAASGTELQVPVFIAARGAVAEAAATFEEQTGHTVKIIAAAPGQIVASLKGGAPADMGIQVDSALRFFCRVAETNSFVAAAYELDVVPSMLSKTTRALEADVHFKLFNRTVRRVCLTDNGARYCDRCRQLLVELEEAERLQPDGMRRPAGKVFVGLHPAAQRVASFGKGPWMTTGTGRS